MCNLHIFKVHLFKVTYSISNEMVVGYRLPEGDLLYKQNGNIFCLTCFSCAFFYRRICNQVFAHKIKRLSDINLRILLGLLICKSLHIFFSPEIKQKALWLISKLFSVLKSVYYNTSFSANPYASRCKKYLMLV